MAYKYQGRPKSANIEDKRKETKDAYQKKRIANDLTGSVLKTYSEAKKSGSNKDFKTVKNAAKQYLNGAYRGGSGKNKDPQKEAPIPKDRPSKKNGKTPPKPLPRSARPGVKKLKGKVENLASQNKKNRGK